MRQCEVLVHRIPAGILTETDNPRGYIFKYYPEYLESKREPVSLTMPLREQEYCSPTLFPYFFNMLSEGENRTLQSSLFHLDKDDDFGILLETACYDTAGAVTIKPLIK